MRVHELAKLLDIGSKECIAKLQALGVEAKSHSSSVDASVVEKLVAQAKGAAPVAPARPLTVVPSCAAMAWLLNPN